MTTASMSARLVFSGLALLVALAAVQAVVVGDDSVNTPARVQRLAQNVERAESVRAVKRL